MTAERAETGRWDESTRPTRHSSSGSAAARPLTPQQEAVGQHLVDVHDHLRGELGQVRSLIDQVRAGALRPDAARGAVNQMTMRQNDWTLGAYCAAYCTTLTQHHSAEDAMVFPHLRRADPLLEPVLDRLQQEHVVIHDVLEALDAALVAHIGSPTDFSGLDRAADELARTLLSHLTYEEGQLVEPLGRHGFYAG